VNSSPPLREWHLTETYKGLITLAVEALKLLALVNGAAAVAVLTYLGSLVSHVRHGAVLHPPNMIPAVGCYCAGVLASTFALVVAYCTQLILYGEELARHEGRPFRSRHGRGISVAVGLALSAAVLFGAGSLLAAFALSP
jgi:hypothetical protein